MMNILHNQWDLGEEESKTTGPWCAYYLLFDILSKAERIIIKKLDNKVIGFCAYEKRGSKKFLIRKNFYKSLKLLIVKSPFIKDKKAFVRYNRLYDKIESKFDNKYDGDIIIFIVDKKHQGNGYGTKLLKTAFDLAKKDNMKKLKIVTDDDCNYKYYESLGFKKIYEEPIYFDKNKKYKEEQFIYEVNLKEGEENEV